MIKKLLILSAAMVLYNMPLQAQSIQINLDYHSFQPFIHFQLNFSNHHRPQSYRMAYLKGYMDGVNDHRYYNHRFAEMVENRRIYETGYRDGFEDRDLLVRLRGREWLRHHRFTYNDYYAPAYSVRIWLSGLSMAFLQAPSRRLPPGWRHKVRPWVRKYRGWKSRRHHHRDYDEDDYEYDDDDDYAEDVIYFRGIQKRYRKRIKRFERHARKNRRASIRRVDYEPDRRRYRSRESSDEDEVRPLPDRHQRERVQRDDHRRRGRGHVKSQQRRHRGHDRGHNGHRSRRDD